MRMAWRCPGALAALLGALSLAACQTAAPPPSPAASPGTAVPDSDQADAGEVVIHVTSNGWHSEIVVARANVPAGAIPETADFAEASYLSFGWGDAAYYPAPEATLGMTLRAALWPTPAVVHLAGLRAPPQEAYPKNETLQLRLSAAGFQAVLTYIDASFERGGRPRARPSAPGLYSFSRFYPATGKFHLFNTCNTWTAKALKTAGVPVDIATSNRAEELMSQLRALRSPR